MNSPFYVRFVAHRLDFDGYGTRGYWNWIKRHRTSPNGIFSYKMFASNYIRIRSKKPDWLRDIKPRKVVLLLRTNVLEQAVSYSKAMRSKIWFSGTEMSRPSTYDAGHIGACVDLIRGQLEFWSLLFDLTETNVCPVSYEDVLSDLDSVVGRVASFLGVRLQPDHEAGPPLLHVQRNNQSFEWMQRYLSECGDAGRGAIEDATGAVKALLARR